MSDQEVEESSVPSAIRRAISRETLGSRLRAVKTRIGRLPRPTILHYTALALILIVAAITRLLPLRWGAYISEFDPYFNYDNMRQIAQNGWMSWYTYTNAAAWFPFGRNSLTTSYPGTSFTGVAIYLFLSAIGVNISLYDSAIYTPVLLGVFACLVTYYFARDLWGKSAGLFAALFLGFSSSLISRTSLGFFRNEAVGIPTMILAFLFFLRGIDDTRSLKATIIYGMLSSLSLTFMAFSWGSFRYAVQVLGLFALALVLLRKYTPRLTLTYGITVGFFLLVGTGLPYLGRTFIEESTTLALIGIMGLLVLMESMSVLKTSRERWILIGAAVLGGALTILVLVQSGIATNLGAKFLATVNPFIRNNIPLVASVAENRPATWASFFLELGAMTLLGVFGFFFAFQRLRPPDVLIIVYGATAFYFAASLVRLSLLLAPAISILAAITVVEFGKPAVDIIRQSVIFPRRKTRFTPRVSREFSLGILLIVFIIVMPAFINAVDSAYTPVTIASASLPTRGAVPDWLQALAWMRDNLPSTAVVFAWWDYGYWITVNTGLHTLADNGTGNLTQIQMIATGFMLNETMAFRLMKQYKVTHVAVFTSYNTGPATCSQTGSFCGFGEDSKWYWMVRIGNGTLIQTPQGIATVTFKAGPLDTNGNPTEYDRIITINGHSSKPEKVSDNYQGNFPLPTSNTVLGHLMRADSPAAISDTNDVPTNGYTAASSLFTKSFSSTNSYVKVYKINYPTDTRLSLLAPNPITAPKTGGNTTLTGTLLTASGQPVANSKIFLEYSTDNRLTNGQLTNLQTITNSTITDSQGRISYTWQVPAISAQNNIIWIRARYAGDTTLKLADAYSLPIPLTQT